MQIESANGPIQSKKTSATTMPLTYMTLANDGEERKSESGTGSKYSTKPDQPKASVSDLPSIVNKNSSSKEPHL